MELAIVLVIIGIILGAVLKGQDLIENARIKKFIAKVKAWENAQWIFYDRKKRFTGDDDGDGLIGHRSYYFSIQLKQDFINANFIEPPYEITPSGPSNTITIGSIVFYVSWGFKYTYTFNPYTVIPEKNIMVISVDGRCDGTFTKEQLKYLEALDRVIDGRSDGRSGRLVAIRQASYLAAPWALAVSPVHFDDWTSSQIRCAVYFFDSKP